MDVENKNYHSVYKAVNKMTEEYTFYSLPLYSNASDIQLNFEQNVKNVLKSAHNQYIKRVNSGEDADTVLNELVEQSLIEIRNISAD